MTNKNYLIIEENIVTNLCVWDGNTETWQPPVNSIQLIQETTSAMIWSAIVVDNKITDWVLAEQMGTADIGFTWDGTTCTTNQPKPIL